MILRSNESQVNPPHDQIALQRYATHSATRGSLLNQQVSPSSVFFQHSPSTAHDGDTQENESPNVCTSNGPDTLSDFVTFVCQESEQSSQNGNRNSPKSQQYSNYNSMLPPPPLPAVTGPLPPMAVPVSGGYSGGDDFCMY